MAGKRSFLIALLATLAMPRPGFASPAGEPRRIGYLLFDNPSYGGSALLAEFHRRMSELGYAEGKDYVIDKRSAGGNVENLPASASELVRANVDVIVIVGGSPAIRAAQAATRTIPIVIVGTGDPVGSGFAASLSRPGGNITGISSANVEITPKLVALLVEASPRMRRLGLLTDPDSSTQAAYWSNAEAAARKANLEFIPSSARNLAQIERAFASMARDRVEGAIVAADSYFASQARLIADIAKKHQIPTISHDGYYAEEGLLMGYGADRRARLRRTADFVDKILKGAKPADLPIIQPNEFKLAINLKTAKALRLVLPETLLARADQLIK